jgi:hypothetical protein
MTNVVNNKTDLVNLRKEAIKRLINEPLFNSAIAEIRGELINSWSSTSPVDNITRENIYSEFIALDKLVARLKSYADDLTFTVKRKNSENAF